MSSIIIIENGEIYSPASLGRANLMLGGSDILKIGDISPADVKGIDFDVIDASGKLVIPGLIDNHVHICGGGGEGGFRTRTPEISLTDITKAGITTLIGVLGTDGTTRTMTNLIAKANGLEEEGITCRVLTGSYQIPVRTATGSITDDIILIDKIIGTGEIALADHRSSHPDLSRLAAVVSDSRLGGILSGKSGIVNIHMGDSRRTIEMLLKLLEETEIPPSQLLPTHMNRNPYLFEKALDYALQGGFVDFTTSTTKQFIEEGEVSAAKALKRMIDRGIPAERITFSSDGQGSLPQFDSAGRMTGLGIGSVSSLWNAVVQAVREEGIDFETALGTVTANPASLYRLAGKGQLREGWDADMVIVDRETLAVETVIAKGKVMVKNGEPLVRGTFE